MSGEMIWHTWTLHAGILANPAKPPATPSNFAAVVVPIIADKLGASTFILELTYMKIWKIRVGIQLSWDINRSTPVYGPPLAYRQDCKPCLWPSILYQKAAYPMMWMRWQLRSWWWRGVILRSGLLLSNPVKAEQFVNVIWRNWPQHLPIPAQNVYTWQDRWRVVQAQEIFLHNDLGWTVKVIKKPDLEL